MAYHEAKAPEHERKSKLSHLELHRGKNGGHMVRHVMDDYGMGGKPEEHHFGKEEGHKVMAHLAKHGKIKTTDEMGEHEPVDGAKEEAEEGED